MIGWIAAHWQGSIAGLALLVSVVSLRVSLRKPVNDWQQKLRNELDQYLHSVQLQISDIRKKLGEIRDTQEGIAKFALYDAVLRKLERNITAPRPKLLLEVRSQMMNIHPPTTLHESMLLARELDSLNSNVEKLSIINSDISNAVPFARLKYKRRLRLVRTSERIEARRMRLRKE
jgi:hypothetical protein